MSSQKVFFDTRLMVIIRLVGEVSDLPCNLMNAGLFSILHCFQAGSESQRQEFRDIDSPQKKYSKVYIDFRQIILDVCDISGLIKSRILYLA